MLSMTFYATTTPDGNVHVQNAVMGLMGQHHVHTRAGFLKWKRQVRKEDLRTEKSRSPCGCGLKPGQVREYDGKTWESDRWGDRGKATA